MLHALVHPQPPHQLTDLVRQLNLVPLRRHLEEQPRVLLKVNFHNPLINTSSTIYNAKYCLTLGRSNRYKRPRIRDGKSIWHLAASHDGLHPGREGRENRLAKAKE